MTAQTKSSAQTDPISKERLRLWLKLLKASSLIEDEVRRRLCDVRVVVGSKRCQCLDQALFTHIGIDPSRQRIVGVKSTVHFRADYEPIADKVLVVEAPGAHPCRLDAVTYRNLRPGVRLGPGGQPFGP